MRTTKIQNLLTATSITTTRIDYSSQTYTNKGRKNGAMVEKVHRENIAERNCSEKSPRTWKT